MSFSKPAVKRKVDDEHRQFQEKWEMQYFFVDHRDTPTCPICTEKVACRGGLAIWRTGHMPGGPFSIGAFWGPKNAPSCS